jgi:3-hydroxybutyryl-CoA dehydrogenase
MAQSIRKVGIIGAGQMGNGIAHVCALAGLPVVINDIAPARLKEALATINGNMSRQVSRQRITEDDKQAALKRITTAESYDGLADCDLVIEAATEKEEVKRKIFSELCPSLKPEALVASNTSSISITRLAAATDRPEKFIGIHFMNPVPLMELVELIRGIATSDATFEASKEFVAKVGKTIAARHLPVGDAGAARGARRFEIPAMPALGEICRGRLARQEGRARLLRLPRGQARPDALTARLYCVSTRPMPAGRSSQ